MVQLTFRRRPVMVHATTGAPCVHVCRARLHGEEVVVWQELKVVPVPQRPGTGVPQYDDDAPLHCTPRVVFDTYVRSGATVGVAYFDDESAVVTHSEQGQGYAWRVFVELDD